MSGGGTIVSWAPYGTHISLRCQNHPNERWSTKNIDYIGARSIFPCAPASEKTYGDHANGCSCSARRLEPVPQGEEHVRFRKIDGLRGDRVAFVADNVLSEERCESLMEKFQAEPGWETIRGGNSQTDASVCERLILDDPGIRDAVWGGIGGSYLPSTFPNVENKDLHPIFHTDLFGTGSEWEKDHLNDHWQITRRDPGGGKLDLHTDKSHVHSFGKETLFTVLVYLNKVKNGGETVVFGNSEEDILFTVNPKPGSVLVFSHNIPHQEKTPQNSTKWVMQSDVVYRVPQSTLETLSAPVRGTLWQLHKVWGEVSGLGSSGALYGEVFRVIHALKEQKVVNSTTVMGVKKILELLQKYPTLNERLRDAVEFLKTIVTE